MLQTAIKAAKEAGKILVDNFGKSHTFSHKSAHELVTNIDVKAEQKIISTIKKDFPEHHFFAEESGSLGRSSEYLWIIDPLDGTHNFIHNLPLFGVSVALAHLGKVVLGVVYLPLLDELYVAQHNKGAFCNGKRLHVSSKKKLSDSFIMHDSGITTNKKLIILSLNKLADEVFGIRQTGSAVVNFALVARGGSEAYIEYNNKPYDNAAGMLLVKGASGRVTDLRGSQSDFKSPGFIASNGKIHKQLVDLIGKIR